MARRRSRIRRHRGHAPVPAPVLHSNRPGGPALMAAAEAAAGTGWAERGPWRGGAIAARGRAHVRLFGPAVAAEALGAVVGIGVAGIGRRDPGITIAAALA